MVASRTVRSLTMLVAALALAALGGCASTRGNLTSAAHNLEYNANTLASDSGAYARGDEAPPPREAPRPDEVAGYPNDYAAARDARALARDAHEFRVVVDEGGSDTDLRKAFDRVSRSYHAVRDEVDHSDNRQAHRDLGAVTDSYRSLQHELGIYQGNEESVPPA